MRRALAALLTAAGATLLAPAAGSLVAAAPASGPPAARPDTRAAERWAKRTLAAMTLDEKIGQLVVPGLNGVYTPLDGDAFEKLDRLVRERKVGGFHVFGGAEALPGVLLNPVYGTSGGRAIKADPLAVAVLLNRLQRTSAVPLLFTADFEGGAGYIVEGATRLPRAMALGASRDAGLAERAGELAAREGRALGVHVDFYPVVDVNNNPRNPVINVRSFGEDPALVSEMAVAYMKGIQKGGMLSTAKHFPGHGDTATDTHLDLALVEKPRAALDAVELPPFKAAIAAGVDAIMSTHIRLPALDPTPGRPATLSRPILTGLLRQELGFDGLVFTDSMSMRAIGKGFGNEQAAGLAVAAGADVVLDPPDPEAALRGIRAAVDAGAIGVDAARALRPPHTARQGSPRARSRAARGRGGGPRGARGTEERGRGRRGRRSCDHARQGRACASAAAPAAGRPGAASFARRLRQRLARGPPGTRARPRAEEALPRPDGGGADRPRHGRRDRPREGARPPLRRDRRRDVRARGVLQRAHGPLARAAGPSRNARRRRVEAARRRSRSETRTSPRSPRSCRR